MEIYVKTALELDALAELLRATVNVAAENRTPSMRGQRRDGLNQAGGLYYLFEVFGLELILVRNQGDVAIDERGDWPFYIIMRSDSASDHDLRCMAEHLGRLLGDVGSIEARVDDLGA